MAGETVTVTSNENTVPADLAFAPGLRDMYEKSRDGSIFGGPRISIKTTPGGSTRAVGVKPKVRRALGSLQGVNEIAAHGR